MLGARVCRRHLQLDGGRDDHTLPQVSDSEHERWATVSCRDDGVPGEDERLCSAVGLGRLHEDAAEHHSVDDQPQNILDDQHRDGQRTLLRHHPAAKTDGHLQQTGGQKHSCQNIWIWIWIWIGPQDQQQLSPGLRWRRGRPR